MLVLRLFSHAQKGGKLRGKIWFWLFNNLKKKLLQEVGKTGNCARPYFKMTFHERISEGVSFN